MKSNSKIKALYIVVNAGFSEDVIEIAREQGATGATIINARGGNMAHEMFMGITMSPEKEIILLITEEKVSDNIMSAVKKKAGFDTPAHSICFTMPVEKLIGIGAVSPHDD